MRFVLLILLFVVFGYALGLVLVNGSDVDVNLLFTQAPTMNLGLLLILSIGLGVLIGLLLSLLLFKVVQNKWELSRIKKENLRLKEELKQAAIAIDRQAHGETLEETIYVDTLPKTTLDK